MFEVGQIRGGYGPINILNGISFRIDDGDAVAVLGPNGAGKSTLMAALTGTLPRCSGTLFMGARDLSRSPSHELVSAGIALVPEGRQVFAPFTVRDNLRLGAIKLSARGRLSERFEYVFGLFPRLAERASQVAGTMSGGEQQMLAIGRALMSKPSLLLLDEPFLGLAPAIVEEIIVSLTRLKADGLTMILVEQKLDIASRCAARAFVMQKGRFVYEGSFSELISRDDLREMYFGSAKAGEVPSI